jgi:hypothetical protein
MISASALATTRALASSAVAAWREHDALVKYAVYALLYKAIQYADRRFEGL